MKLGPRIFDIGLGLTILFWSSQSFLAGNLLVGESRLNLVVSTTGLLAGILLLTRVRGTSYPETSRMAGALPSIILSAILVAGGLRSENWGLLPTLTLLTGVFVTLLSFGSLGRKFAIFPRRQELQQGGPYRWIRHPAYLGELLIVLAATLANPTPQNFLLYVACVLATIYRIHLEEQTLGPEYTDYAAKVRFRLLPGIW